jgi:hypothetical protein
VALLLRAYPTAGTAVATPAPAAAALPEPVGAR